MEAPPPPPPPPSRQERRAVTRAVTRAVKKKRHIALTLPNVLSALEGLEEGKWWDRGDGVGLGYCLGVSLTRQDEIRRQCSTHLQQSTAVISHFLELHPDASWRAVVRALDGMKETEMADSLRHLCEPLTDLTLTVARVTAALESVGDLDLLGGWLGVPLPVRDVINESHRGDRECKAALSEHFVNSVPGASWTTLAGALYYCEERKALRAVGKNFKEGKEPSLTLHNVLSVCEGVTNWRGLGNGLGVPLFKLHYIHYPNPTASEWLEAVVKEWLAHHPAPSWKGLARALYKSSALSALQRLYGKYMYLAAPAVARRLSAIRQVMVEKGYVEQTVMQAVFIGPARSGKSSLKNRLTGKPAQKHTSSTGVADKAVRVEISSSTVQLAGLDWNALEDLDDEAVLLCGDILQEHAEQQHKPPTPAVARRLSAIRQVMVEKGYVEQTVMQAVFIGPARSGKSSLKNRLTGKPAQKHTSSTGVADKAVRVEISSSTVQLAGLDWNALEDLDDEAVLLCGDILQEHAEQQHKPPSECKQNQRSLSTRRPEKAVKQSSNFSLSSLIHRLKQMFALSSKVELQHDSEEQSSTENFLPEPTSMFEVAISKKKSSKQKPLSSSPWTLYLTDTGGQPEFQGLVRSMVIGPSLFIIVLPLDKDLHTKYVVEYQHPNGDIMAPYTTSLTSREAVLQSLATISSVGSFTKTVDGNQVHVKPKALFVGTHSDKLASREQFLAIDRELQELIKTTDAYRDGLIEFASEEQLILPINNLSEDDGDVKAIRAVVERVGKRGSDYQVRTPYPTLIFSIAARYLNKPILTYDEGFQIARKCGIETEEEFGDALWFLHNRVGVIRYFQDIPELHSVIINSPQYIFDKVTELIVSTFTFENTPANVYEQFLKKGIFPVDVFERLADMDVLTAQQLICLLEHLHIIAPLHEGGAAVAKYFAPSALSHAEDALPSSCCSETAALPPLLLSFASGYCPTGLFAVLVVHLLSGSKKAALDWILEQDKIYRNSITLSIGPFDAFTFTVLPSHIRIQLAWSAPTSDRSRLPLGGVCCDVRGCVEDALSQVVQLLHYTEKAQYSLGFPCPGEDHHHCAVINCVGGEPVNLTCTLAKKRFDLPSGHTAWFNQVSSTVREEHIDQLAALLQPVAGRWSLFLGQLGLLPSSLELIAANNAGRPNVAMLCLVEGLTLWVRSHEKPAFKSISEVLRGRVLPNMTLAADIEAFSTRV